jgi:hypothetical protein
MSKLALQYNQQKIDFLDSLQPDDFRNGGSFNQAEIIIDQLNSALYKAAISNVNKDEFITKAVTHLFRENSAAVKKAIDLATLYLEMRFEDLKE